MTRLLCEVGRAGAARDVLDGGDVDAGTGRLLSVAELQAALQAARRDATTRPTPSATPSPTPAATVGSADTATTAETEGTGVDVAAGHDRGDGPAGRWPRPTGDRWVAVLGAHPGAGASTVALALADALAEAGQPVHLVSCHGPSRCGLLFAPTVELGNDGSKAWRTGRRGPRITISRPLAEAAGQLRWPTAATGPAGTGPDGTGPGGTRPGGCAVVDVEPGASPASVAAADAVVVVSRAGAGGLAQAELLLEALHASTAPVTGPGRDGAGAVVRPVLLIVVGAGRWPAAVSGHAGPLARRLRAGKRLVVMPIDRHLATYGVSGRPLPGSVHRAGGAAVRLLPGLLPRPPGGRGAPRNATTPAEQSAPGALPEHKDP